MKLFFKTIKYDYLQRTRSYTFLITLCASLAIAYTFVPEPNASYSTMRIGDYVGSYNSAWFGYVTAIMTSVFLSLVGFYLVNSGIKTDIQTKVGQIVASTAVSNFKYLFSKVLSNFLVLLTIVCVVLLMSIILFFLYNDGSVFSPFQFIKPYTLIALPAMFFVSVLAVIFEVLLSRYSVIQNVLFFFLFSWMMVFVPKNETQLALDVFGAKIVIHEMEASVKTISKIDTNQDLSIGYVLGNTKQAKTFSFTGVDFPIIFIFSRVILMFLGVGLIGVMACFFHRFDLKERMSTRIKSGIDRPIISRDISISNLVKSNTDYSLFPLLRIELLLLIRKGKKWLWLINGVGMLLLSYLPLNIAHQMVLPILWFIQVSRLSELTIRDILNNTCYFAFASYKPLQRLLVTQLSAGIILILFLSMPLLIRFTLESEVITVVSIIVGGIFIVCLATALGILSRSKKLFEVLFFMLTYMNINGIEFLDYYGAFNNSITYILKVLVVIMMLLSIIILVRKRQLNNLV